MKAIFLSKLIPRDTKIDFMKLRYMTYIISILLVILSMASIFYKQFNYGIDFIGGINIEIRTNETPDLAIMRQLLNELNIGEVILQSFSDENDLSIKVGVSNEDDLTKQVELIKQTLADNLTYQIDYRKIDFVGPQVGNQMIIFGTNAMILSFVSIMLYVWARFEWQFGVGVIVALIHDVILGLGMMSVMQYDFNLSTIAAILTIIGYSVNNSVVIYDRIKENLRKYTSKTIEQIINMSINETLSRTIITTITTLLANMALIIFAGEAIHSFSILVFFGISMGAFSSIFLSAPILTLFNLKHTKYKQYENIR
ncbi:MAG: protein translocase subunit SecF [Rickettsiaceae bacterium]|nr:protein translocase subunit SecF [Rickettsiaceae bacterium]